MDKKQFTELARTHNMVPVYKTIPADMFTPVSAYLKIRESGVQSFLLESVESADNIGRYSFIGKNPARIYSNLYRTVTVSDAEGTILNEGNILDIIETDISSFTYAKLPELPFFSGGLVGFLGYENISLIEQVIPYEKGSLFPDSIFGLYNDLYVFDHYTHQLILIVNVNTSDADDKDQLFELAQQKLERMKKELENPITLPGSFCVEGVTGENFSSDEFRSIVEKCKQNITEGDIFQIVISKRFSASFKGDLINVYRALRIINPSPYMYFLEFNAGFTVAGTSPENLVKVTDGIVELMPIAGTRKRGRNTEEDIKMETELINDPKERAEHYMLVDLGRNDAGRVCTYGSVKVNRQMYVRRFSHVMHMVSDIEGQLAPGNSYMDVLKACFPAGTVTGAPKIRAMQLIRGYEKQRRDIYAGAVGYIDFSGNMDMCIAIRTLFAKNKTIYWQAGAGIVADSIPQLEEKEITNKSEAMKKAIQYAGVINENTGN